MVLSDCNYYLNNLRVISSNLVTPTNFPKFQTPSFLPFFKAQQGFETPQKQNTLNSVTFQYQPLIPYYNQKVGYLLVTYKKRGSQVLVDITMRLCIMITSKANMLLILKWRMTMNNENILKHWDKKDLIESYYNNIARAAGILSDVYDEEEDYSLKVKEAKRILKDAQEYKEELISRNDKTLLF